MRIDRDAFAVTMKGGLPRRLSSVTMGRVVPSIAGVAAAVKTTTAKGADRDFRICQKPLLNGFDECFPNKLTVFLDVRQEVVFDLRDVIILNKALLRCVIVTGRKLMDFVDACKRHGPQFRAEIEILIEIAII